MENRIDSLSDKIKIVFSDSYKSTSDTFDLARFAMPKSSDESAIDLGCGCGGIHLWWYANGYSGKTIAIDVQDEACKLLNASVRISELEDKVTVICKDLRNMKDFHDIRKNSIDLIACNPPYYNTGNVSRIQAKSVAHHEVMCMIDDVTSFASMYLKTRGRLCISYRMDRLSDIVVSMRQHGIEPKRIQFVISGEKCAIKTFFIEGVKGGSPAGLVCSRL